MENVNAPSLTVHLQWTDKADTEPSGALLIVPVVPALISRHMGMDDFIAHMKGLQDLLGVMNDVAVTRGLLNEILEGVSDPGALQYAGGVLGWRTCHFHELLGGFEQRWEDFVEAKHPWWKQARAEAAE